MAKNYQMTRPFEPELDQAADNVLGRFVGYHLKRAQHILMGDLNATLRPFELRMLSYSTLSIIVNNPDVRASQISDVLAIERSNLVVILNELEEFGLIRRHQVPADRRAYALAPTSKGEALYGEATAAVEAHESRIFASATEAEIATIVRVMKNIHRCEC